MTLLSLHATSYLQIILFITLYALEHESLAIDHAITMSSELTAYNIFFVLWVICYSACTALVVEGNLVCYFLNGC